MTHSAELDLALEEWTPRPSLPSALARPGQQFPDERYLDRFAQVDAEIAAGFRGVTTHGEPVPGLFRLRQTGASTRPMRAAAQALLETFTPAQRRSSVFPIGTPNWQRWHGFFTRLMRHGLCVEDMTALQCGRLEALLQASLSAAGAALVRDIRATNQLAGELSGRFVDLGADVYWLSIMGEPSADEPWGWQLDGHHVNVNAFVLGDQVVMTPTFLGAEPTSIRSGPLAGLRVFHAETHDALTLMRALSVAQQHQAVIAEQLQVEVFSGAFRDNVELGQAGAAVATFSEEQRALLGKLIGNYVGRLPAAHARIWLNDVLAYLDQTTFAWIGGFDDVQPFYYRIQSPIILIEFNHINGIAMNNDLPSRNHVHTVVRTPNGNDYGKDLLRQHIQACHSHNKNKTRIV